MLKEKILYGLFIDNVEISEVYRGYTKELSNSHIKYLKQFSKYKNEIITIKPIKKYIEENFKVIEVIELV